MLMVHPAPALKVSVRLPPQVLMIETAFLRSVSLQSVEQAL
jgi:hypothetical protein